MTLSGCLSSLGSAIITNYNDKRCQQLILPSEKEKRKASPLAWTDRIHLVMLIMITWVPQAPSCSCTDELVVCTTHFSVTDDEVNELDVTLVASTCDIS